MTEIYRYVLKRKKFFSVLVFILGVAIIYSLGFRFGDFFYKITH